MAEPHLPATLRAMNLALRSGNFDMLTHLCAELETSAREPADQLPADLVNLQALRQLAAENQLLLDAVGRGLRQASKRLNEIRDARRGLRTYGPGGASRAWVDQTGQGKRF